MNLTVTELFKRFDALVQKLGAGAGVMYGVIHRQVIINGWKDVVLGTICLVLGVFFGKAARKYIINKEDPELIVAIIALSVASLIAFVCWTTSGMDNLLNPDFHVYQYIMTLVKQ